MTGRGDVSKGKTVAVLNEPRDLVEPVRASSAADGEAPQEGNYRIAFESIEHEFVRRGSRLRALGPVDLSIRDGDFVALVGPSGCGKTTLMNMVAGLVRPTTGEVRLDGRAVTGPTQSIGYMFARDALLPWRTARQNVEFSLETRLSSRSERRERAVAMLQKVGLDGFQNSYPTELSQGMRQRVAIARTLAPQPSVLLMDEPFAALDAQTKILLEEEFVRLWEAQRSTVLFVTHDLGEAIALADRVLLISARPGRIKIDMTIDIPRPRDLEALRFDPEYTKLYKELWSALRVEFTGGQA